MYFLKKYNSTKTVKIYVNGKPLPYFWNNYKNKEDALEQINKGNIVNCNPLVDNVEIREVQIVSFGIERQKIF